MHYLLYKDTKIIPILQIYIKSVIIIYYLSLDVKRQSANPSGLGLIFSIIEFPL